MTARLRATLSIVLIVFQCRTYCTFEGLVFYDDMDSYISNWADGGSRCIQWDATEQDSAKQICSADTYSCVLITTHLSEIPLQGYIERRVSDKIIEYDLNVLWQMRAYDDAPTPYGILEYKFQNSSYIILDTFTYSDGSSNIFRPRLSPIFYNTNSDSALTIRFRNNGTTIDYWQEFAIDNIYLYATSATNEPRYISSNVTPTAIPITYTSPLIQTTNTIAPFQTNNVTPPPSRLSSYAIGIIVAASTLVVIGVVYVLWVVCGRRMGKKRLANNDINNAVIIVTDGDDENVDGVQQTKKREHVTKGGSEDIIQYENKVLEGVDVIANINRRGTNQLGEGDNDESGDSDDMYIDENAENELKGDEIEGDVNCNDETANDKEVENEKEQGTNGDVYYDEYYDKIWKREVNKK